MVANFVEGTQIFEDRLDVMGASSQAPIRPNNTAHFEFVAGGQEPLTSMQTDVAAEALWLQ